MTTDRSTTAINLLPVSIYDDLYSAFYSGSGLPVRVVTAGELPQRWLYRAISAIYPGSLSLVCHNDFREFQTGSKRVVTILKPDQKLTLLWGFKQDAATNTKGEPCGSISPGSTKKMTDPNILREKRAEQKIRERSSLFSPYTSGHIQCGGFRLHKKKSHYCSGNGYHELICYLNPRQQHGGYLLDPKREASFQRISEIMTNILAMEEANGNGNCDAFQEPVTLCMYDSYRGILLPPEKLDRATVEKIRENANALSRYASSVAMELKLYNLLAQSGCDRFLSLLKKTIPENIEVLADSGMIFPVSELIEAIKQSDARKFHDLLSSIGETLLNRIGLPGCLLDQLLRSNVFTLRELKRAEKAGQFVLQNIDSDRLDHLLTDTFPKQADICRTLLKHGLFFPVLSECQEYSSSNPLVVCLLVAHGCRAQHPMTHKIDTSGALTLLYNANKFLNAGLLTEEEVYRIRHDVLLDALCFGDRGLPFADHQIEERFRSLVHKLYELFLAVPAAENPSALEDHNQAEKMCHELLGKELWDFYHDDHVHGSQLKLFLESRLSPHRYSDDELRRHLDWLKYAGSQSSYWSYGPVYLLGKTYDVRTTAVTGTVGDEGKHTDWLVSVLATPPAFDRREFTRVGRYRAITQTAGLHYYQYHHPNRALAIAATNRVNYVHRRYHGLDHALRTQMATEFVIEILPSYHKPFRQLLATYPALSELLKIAELYHDAVAEDEPKEAEESRAAELFERDMRSLNEYPDKLITLVATALKNRNSHKMSPVQTPFTADDQCSGEELLLRQVLRFGEVVDILRRVPLPKNFLEVEDNFVVNPVSEPKEGEGGFYRSFLRPFYWFFQPRSEPSTSNWTWHTPKDPDKFDPQAIGLLAVVNNPNFTRLIKGALLTFRDLAALTGGWHLESSNPAADRYQLKVNNQQRRLLIEHSHDPYMQMREVLDDLVRLEIAKRAGISTCLDQDGHWDYANNGPTPSCWDKKTVVVGTYRKLHSEVELRQVQVPDEMTLSEKVRFIAESELTDADRLALSCAISSGIDAEINRLRQEGIQPAIGTPSQDELGQIYERPDSIGACLLTERGIVVQRAEHQGTTYFRMVKSLDSRSQAID